MNGNARRRPFRPAARRDAAAAIGAAAVGPGLICFQSGMTFLRIVTPLQLFV
jgi:hypothetical protein